MNEVSNVIRVTTRDVPCDGGGGQLGHPRVFIAIGDGDRASCPYCGQVFVFTQKNKEGT